MWAGFGGLHEGGSRESGGRRIGRGRPGPDHRAPKAMLWGLDFTPRAVASCCGVLNRQ